MVLVRIICNQKKVLQWRICRQRRTLIRIEVTNDFSGYFYVVGSAFVHIQASFPENYATKSSNSPTETTGDETSPAAKKPCLDRHSNHSGVLQNYPENHSQQYQQRLAELFLAQAVLAPESNNADFASLETILLQKQPWLLEIGKYAEPTNDAGLFVCRICKYDTRNLYTFRAHVQKHENKKQFQCSACEYRLDFETSIQWTRYLPNNM